MNYWTETPHHIRRQVLDKLSYPDLAHCREASKLFHVHSQLELQAKIIRYYKSLQSESVKKFKYFTMALLDGFHELNADYHLVRELEGRNQHGQKLSQFLREKVEKDETYDMLFHEIAHDYNRNPSPILIMKALQDIQKWKQS